MKISRKGSHLIVGSAIGIAAITVAIDHTRHRLPEPEPATQTQQGAVVIIEDESPCGLDSPCALGESPCAMDAAPCSLDGSPCAMTEESPCSL